MYSLITVFIAVFSLEVIVILLLTFMPRISPLGKDIHEAWTKAPWLDLIVSTLIWIPWLLSGIMAGWLGIAVSLLAQFLVMQLWCFSHELAHRKDGYRSHIVSFHDRHMGWWRNNLALWATVLAVPLFFHLRFCEIFVYPFLIWLLGFPNYNHSEWINVSRQKFQGLIGYDLIWCLYCDWMTGVYSLGAEMLRNVESFWCPIRFYNGKKCENCKLDFPDLENGWVAADGNMSDVERVLEKKYSHNQRSWFGHQERQSDR